MEDWNWETIFTDIISLYSTTLFGQQSKSNAVKNAKKAITPFKVIQGYQGRYQSKARMRLIPISDNCFFSLHVTAEALRGKIDRKSAISLQRGHFDTNFQDVPINNYAWIVRPCHTTLPLTVFTLRNFVADFRQAKCDFRGKTAVLRF